jgi:hypothetical protein
LVASYAVIVVPASAKTLDAGMAAPEQLWPSTKSPPLSNQLVRHRLLAVALVIDAGRTQQNPFHWILTQSPKIAQAHRLLQCRRSGRGRLAPINFHLTFALDRYRSERLAMATVAKPCPGIGGHVHSADLAEAGKPRRDVDRVTPQIESELVAPDDPGDHGPDMDADPSSQPAGVPPAACRIANALRTAVMTGSRIGSNRFAVAITQSDRLDLLPATDRHDLLASLDQLT